MDARFFKKQGPFALRTLVELLGCSVPRGNLDTLIEGVVTMDKAGPRHLCAFYNPSYREQLKKLKAGVLLIREDFAHEVPDSVIVLITENPRQKMIEALNLFYKPYEECGVHPRALVHESAVLGEGCFVGPGAVIQESVTLDKNVHIGAHTVIGRGVEIGKGTVIEPHVTLSHALIGQQVHIKTGARIGQKGFGFVVEKAGKSNIEQPQIGRVLIGDRVQVGANTTIDRGSLRDTVIGCDVWIDNLVQIAHNVRIGDGSILVAQVGIAGSTCIEKGVMLGGQVGIAGHLTLGRGCKVMAKSGVMRSLKEGETVFGIPAIHHKTYFRQHALLCKSKKKI